MRLVCSPSHGSSSAPGAGHVGRCGRSSCCRHGRSAPAASCGGGSVAASRGELGRPCACGAGCAPAADYLQAPAAEYSRTSQATLGVGDVHPLSRHKLSSGSDSRTILDAREALLSPRRGRASFPGSRSSSPARLRDRRRLYARPWTHEAQKLLRAPRVSFPDALVGAFSVDGVSFTLAPRETADVARASRCSA